MAMPKASSIVLAVVLVLAMAVFLGLGDYRIRDFLHPKLHTFGLLREPGHKGTMIAAASEAFWNGGKACGDKYVVTCTGATNAGVPQPCTGQSDIVDLCPAGSCRATIDLSQEAFAIIADRNAGKIKVEYSRI